MNSPDQNQSSNKLTSENYEKFRPALEALYIKGNSSGRIQFLKEWPQAARYIFGEELVKYDMEGAQDRQRRAALEDEAEARRADLEVIVHTLEQKSVDKGSLQLPYIEEVVKKLGRDLALVLYAQRIVDRFIPPPPSAVKEEAQAKPQQAPAAAPPPRPAQTMEEMMESIKPISLEPPPAPAPEKPPGENH